MSDLDKTATKALQLCREYDTLSTAIGVMTRMISNELAQCPRASNKDGHTSHVAEAYAPYLTDSEWNPVKAWHDQAAQAEILAPCQHCQLAHATIQGRKDARKKLGGIKRAIRAVGKARIAARLENWSVRWDAMSRDTVPEKVLACSLFGEVYGHPDFEDGHFVTTSIVTGIERGGCIRTYTGSLYRLGDVSPAYEAAFPGAKVRVMKSLRGQA